MHRSRKLRAAFVATTLLGSVIALAGSAQAAIPGLVRVSASTTGGGFQSVTATCPAGQVLIGAGYQVTGATGEAIVDDFVPTIGPTGSVFVGAYEADPPYMPALNYTLTAFAICSDPLPGLNLASAVSVSNSNDKSVVATCAAGTTPLGTGFQINGATGEVAVNFLRPSGTGVQVTAYEEDPLAGNWTVTAFAICATPPTGLQHISAGNPIANSPDFHAEPAGCAPGRILTGLGFQVVSASGEVVVDDFFPNGGVATAPTSLTVGAYEADGLATDWTLTAFGICAS